MRYVSSVVLRVTATAAAVVKQKGQMFCVLSKLQNSDSASFQFAGSLVPNTILRIAKPVKQKSKRQRKGLKIPRRFLVCLPSNPKMKIWPKICRDRSELEAKLAVHSPTSSRRQLCRSTF